MKAQELIISIINNSKKKCDIPKNLVIGVYFLSEKQYKYLAFLISKADCKGWSKSLYADKKMHYYFNGKEISLSKPHGVPMIPYVGYRNVSGGYLHIGKKFNQL